MNATPMAYILLLQCSLVANCTLAQTREPSVRQMNQFGHSTGWQTNAAINREVSVQPGWKVPVGEGRSQIVGSGDVLFVAAGESAKRDSSDIVDVTTRVMALEHATGKQMWAYEHRSQFRGDQQTFGGAMASPQATPLLLGSRLILTTFTGHLICIDQRSGELLWTQDLVTDMGAVPVQFGFSSSPVADPDSPDDFLVLAAGPKGGLFHLNAKDARRNWKAECTTPSYATPTLATLGDVRQWVVVSENEVLGVEAENGEILWRFPLPSPGLTNVPSPLVVDDQTLVISGQGCDGTIGLHVTRAQGEWRATEKWRQPRVQFFYTNWAMCGERVLIGCTSAFLATIDVDTGEIVGRLRGLGDGNIARTPTGIAILGQKGKLTLSAALPAESNGTIQFDTELKLTNDRCWTPFSFIGDGILLRAGDQLMQFEMAANTANALPNQLTKIKEIATQASSDPSVDRVAEIFERFEANGPEAALALYSKLRANGKLNVEQRIELIEAAKEQGLGPVAEEILNDAVEDFPSDDRLKSMLPDRD